MYIQTQYTNQQRIINISIPNLNYKCLMFKTHTIKNILNYNIVIKIKIIYCKNKSFIEKAINFTFLF